MGPLSNSSRASYRSHHFNFAQSARVQCKARLCEEMTATKYTINLLTTSTGAYHRVWRHQVEQEKIAPACRQPSGLPWQAAVHPSSTMRFLLGTRIHSDEPAVDCIITRTCCAVLSVEGQMCQTPAGFRSRRTVSQVPHTQQNCCHGFHTRLSLKCGSDDPEVFVEKLLPRL